MILLYYHLFLIDDCTQVTVNESTVVPDGYVNIDITIPGLMAVHSSANRVRIYVWTPVVGDFNLSSSTRRFSRVRDWKDPNSCDGMDRFQTARISAMASFESGSESFSASVLPLIANSVHVSTLTLR